MLKRFLSFALLVGFVSTLAGCSGEEPKKPETTPAAKPADTKPAAE